jgi:hypothetical protein
MLQTATVHPATLAILKRLMALPELRQFNLVGGTALALQIGHRESIDLDLFTVNDFDNGLIISVVAEIGNLEVLVDKPPFLQLRLDDVKLDFLKFPYGFVQEFVEMEGIRLVDVERIAVLKLLAIARRGSKKDFIDIFFILKTHSLEAIMLIFSKILPSVDTFHILKSLNYFEDAESDANPRMFIQVSWSEVKRALIKVLGDFFEGSFEQRQ